MDHQQREGGTPFVTIVGERVALGPLRRDLPYHRWLSDFSTTRTGGTARPMTEEQGLAWYERHTANEREAPFAIYERATSRPIGTTMLKDIDLDNRRAEFAIVRSHSFCALSHSSCAQNPTVFEPSCRCPLIMCEKRPLHGAQHADRRRNSGIFCRVAHKLWDFWRRNCGVCTAARTHTWLKNYGILQLAWSPLMHALSRQRSGACDNHRAADGRSTVRRPRLVLLPSWCNGSQ